MWDWPNVYKFIEWVAEQFMKMLFLTLTCHCQWCGCSILVHGFFVSFVFLNIQGTVTNHVLKFVTCVLCPNSINDWQVGNCI